MTLKASVQYALLSAATKYVQLSYQAYLDTRGRYPTYRDYVLSGDIARLSFTKGFKETVHLDEARRFGIDKTLHEDLIISESIGVSLNKSLKEQLGIPDIASLGFSKPSMEELFLSDRYSLESSKGISENISIFTELRNITFTKSIFDVVNISDEVFVNKEGAQIQEFANVTDAMSRQILKGISDNSAVNEYLDYQLMKGVLDSAFLQDNLSNTIHKVLSEKVFTEDVVNMFRGRLLQESFNSIDSQIFGVNKSIGDAALIDESIFRSIGKSFEDLCTASDKRIFSLAKSGIEEQINATDTGFISTQSYTQYDYFANDYVGSRITF